jgi:hypothetical protein
MPYLRVNASSVASDGFLICRCLLLLGLLGLQSSLAQATPPPETVAEGFGIPTAEIEGVEKTTAERITALLAETPDAQDYGTTERCLSRSQIKRYEVLGSNLMLIHGRRGKVWINQFPRKCMGLRRNMPLIMETRGSQVCANDQFYARQPWERMDDLGRRGTSLGSVSCMFSPFEAVSVEQAEMIKQAAKKGVFR